MAHLALYRKYRPKRFGDVVSQGHVTETLKRAVVEDRVAHAFLFAGPRGTGKTSTARILAKSLNCEKRGADGEPCGLCGSCQAITEGSSIDVIEYDAASHGSVDDAREIREKVAYAAAAGRWKVYIIDECHMLSPAANNALLKVLEEPPAHVVFVFATTEPQKVLQTLIDRCQRYEFRSITSSDLARHIENVGEAEAMVVEEEAALLIAARASGSARDALSMLDQIRSYSGDKVAVEDVRSLLGSLPEDLFFEAVDLIADRDAGGAFAFADRLIKSGTDLREFIRSFIDHLRSLFLIHHAPAAREILETTDDSFERLSAQANRISPVELLRVVDLANEASLQMRQAIDGRLALEIALARMARAELHGSSSALLARIERLESGSSRGEHRATPDQVDARASVGRESPKPKSAQRVAAAVKQPARPPADKVVRPEAPGEIDIERVRRAWPVIMEKVKHRKISFHALLQEGTPTAWQSGELVLQFAPRARFHRDNVSDPSKNTPLVEAFEEVLGVRARIQCTLSSEPLPDKPLKDDPELPKGVPDEGEDPGDAQPKDAIDLIRETFSGAEVVEE